MPFEAAKAVAATFCYTIRYALTPLFGPDFISMCNKPGDEGFGRMVIDPDIVRRCTAECREYREIASRETCRTPTPATPSFRGSPVSGWSKSPKYRPHSRRLFDFQGRYCTDPDSSDKYPPSPRSTIGWTPAHQPRSVGGRFTLPSPVDILSSHDVSGGYDAPPNSPGSSESSNVSPRTKKRGLEPSGGGDVALVRLAESALSPAKRARSPVRSTKETRAAYVLMQLHFADTSLKESDTLSKKRRASS